MSSSFQNTSVKVYDNLGTAQKKVDVYAPPENQAFPLQGYPVVFYVHGGAWHVGDKQNAQQTCQALAQEGYVSVAASYSLSCMSNPQMEAILGVVIIVMLALALTSRSVTQMMLVFVLMVIIVFFFVILWMFLPREHVEHPDHILDVAQAFRWTVDHIEEYGGDPNKIYVVGHSAGGHLAALLSTNFHYLDSVGVTPDKVRACVAISGVYSDKRMQQTRLGTQLLLNAFGHRKHYYDAFPVYNVTKDTPPFLLINAGMDISLKRHTLDLHYVLRQSGVFVETEYFENKSHWNIMHGWKRDNAVLSKIQNFIEEVEEYYHERALAGYHDTSTHDTSTPEVSATASPA